MDFDTILELIASSTDFNRGILTGIISTIHTFLTEDAIDEEMAIAILDRDFNHEDINLLSDSVLQLIDSEEENEDEEENDEDN